MKDSNVAVFSGNVRKKGNENKRKRIDALEFSFWLGLLALPFVKHGHSREVTCQPSYSLHATFIKEVSLGSVLKGRCTFLSGQKSQWR